MYITSCNKRFLIALKKKSIDTVVKLVGNTLSRLIFKTYFVPVVVPIVIKLKSSQKLQQDGQLMAYTYIVKVKVIQQG